MNKLVYLLLFPYLLLASPVKTGLEVFFEEDHVSSLKGKKIGLITNHTGVDSNLVSNIQRFLNLSQVCSLQALFSPEHGITGRSYAEEVVKELKNWKNVPIYNLYGATKRPTPEMLKGIDVLIYDIQEIGARSYTYLSTLCYAMEEAAKHKISFIVLDRPNPINGEMVDGPMLQEKYRSFVGYINVPYCHGMTIGELAKFFNEEYKVGCDLKVIPMKGWKRSMSFKETGLPWIPTSPHIPEPDTPFFYCSTGILGELSILNIGVGYTLPFKVVGAPWIHAQSFALHLNNQKIPGARFLPFHFSPFYGLYKGESCEGVMIVITNAKIYRPLTVQYLLFGALKSLYPEEFIKRLDNSVKRQDVFTKVIGNEKIYQILKGERYPFWKLMEFQKEQKTNFIQKRKKYLLSEYN